MSRDEWDAAHAAICKRGDRTCSAHRPGNWKHLALDAVERITEARREGDVEALHEAADHLRPRNWTGPNGTLIHLRNWLNIKAAATLRGEAP